MPRITVVGGGLAGCEAAWRLANDGWSVDLFEMRPVRTSPAHRTDRLAELVCSNSLGALEPTSPAGILKEELRLLGSLILGCAEKASLPAGKALAVDRDLLASLVTTAIESHPSIAVHREEVCALPEEPCIIATGPLSSEAMTAALAEAAGGDCLYFFDAVAPVVTLDSIDQSVVYRAGRYGQQADYLNCPMTEEQYRIFYAALADAERVVPHAFEDPAYFEGCLPIEVIASRGPETMRFGPLRPVGLPDPRTGREPFAVVQLRQDNCDGTLFNLVGFQTSLRWGEQDRVFRLIPGLERAEFARYGVMHRNAYVNAPRVLDPRLRIRGRDALFLAGQITGVEGYLESAAMGIVAAVNCSLLRGNPERPPVWPRESVIGSLIHYLMNAEPSRFQPMNANLGILPPVEGKRLSRPEKCRAASERAIASLRSFLEEIRAYGILR
jgi:methylenetetrahydrofolate--tRNA-(uracil-5-)-methyltransferase